MKFSLKHVKGKKKWTKFLKTYIRISLKNVNSYDN
jgi:hypothetical protein